MVGDAATLEVELEEQKRALESAAETRQIPIIAMTGYAMEDDREKALASGCDEYFTKPPAFKQLEEMIEALLQRTPPPNR